jgi:hypothetical protein
MASASCSRSVVVRVSAGRSSRGVFSKAECHNPGAHSGAVSVDAATAMLRRRAAALCA